MRIISRKGIRSAIERHGGDADLSRALLDWELLARKAVWKNFADVKKTFRSADLLPNPGRLMRVCVDILNNRFRLIILIDCVKPNAPNDLGGKVYVQDLLTHAEYDKKDWTRE